MGKNKSNGNQKGNSGHGGGNDPSKTVTQADLAGDGKTPPSGPDPKSHLNAASSSAATGGKSDGWPPRPAPDPPKPPNQDDLQGSKPTGQVPPRQRVLSVATGSLLCTHNMFPTSKQTEGRA